MPDLVIGPAVIEQARVAVAGEARRVPALADALAAPSVASFGGLATAGMMAAALGELVGALRSDLDVAGARLDQVDRSLDATLSALEAADRDAAAPMARV
jgi:hypothetical protein